MARLTRLPDTLTRTPMALGFPDRAQDNHDRDAVRWHGDNLRKLYNTKRRKVLRLEILERDGWTCRQIGALLVGKAPVPNSPVIAHIKKPERNLGVILGPRQPASGHEGLAR